MRARKQNSDESKSDAKGQKHNVVADIEVRILDFEKKNSPKLDFGG